MLCPCCSNNTFADCCQPFINGKKIAPTAESLMRSRYSAYTLANIDYIAKTMRGEPKKGFNKKEAKQWAEAANWQKLEILQANENDVEFKAYYQLEGEQHTLHEHSLFKFSKGQWYYIGIYTNPKSK